MTPDQRQRVERLAVRLAMTATERAESFADEFHRATGHFMPGCSVPAAVGGVDEDGRRHEWEAWVEAERHANIDALRACLAALEAFRAWVAERMDADAAKRAEQAEQERDMLRGAMLADDERLQAACIKAFGPEDGLAHGCDGADALADAVLWERQCAEQAEAKLAPPDTHAEAVREAAKTMVQVLGDYDLRDDIHGLDHFVAEAFDELKAALRAEGEGGSK